MKTKTTFQKLNNRLQSTKSQTVEVKKVSTSKAMRQGGYC